MKLKHLLMMVVAAVAASLLLRAPKLTSETADPHRPPKLWIAGDIHRPDPIRRP